MRMSGECKPSRNACASGAEAGAEPRLGPGLAGTLGLVRRAAQQAAPVGTRLHVGPRADADGGRRRCVQLTCSCCVMTAAWYLHLKYKEWPIWKAILFSWLFALGEYCLQVAER